MDTYFRKTSCNQARSSRITQLIASMIGEASLPLGFVEYPRFRELLNFLEPGYKVPGRTYMTSQLRLLYDTRRAKVKENLQDATYVSLTTDCWSSRAQEGYMTVTAHFVDSSWECQTAVLDTSPVVTMDDDGNVVASRHTKDALASQLQRVAEDWGIATKVTAVVHDNASNVKTIGNDALGAIDLGCAAHTLQLAVNHGLEESRQIQTLIGGANRLVGHFRHSVLATKALEAKQESMGQDKKRLISSVKTRWNSVLEMLERLQETRWPVCGVLSDRTLTKWADASTLELKDDQWALIEMLVPCLRPLKVATEVLSAEENVSSSIVLPIISGLLDNHLTTNQDDSETIRKFKTKTCTEIKARFLPDDFERGASTLGSAFDPRFKDLAFLTAEQKETTTNFLKEQLATEEALQADDNGPDPPEADNDNAQRDPPKLGMAYLLGANAAHIIPKKSAEEEYRDFLREGQLAHSAKPLTWWKSNENRFPSVAKQARKYLGIPATSVPSERVFSSAGNIVTAKRSCLKAENVNMLIFLSKNLRGHPFEI
nr:E3 SUMO-protein ligase ZBED1-like [Lytechinus pictus]